MVRVMRSLYRIEGEYHLLVIRFISFGKCQLKAPLLEGALREGSSEIRLNLCINSRPVQRRAVGRLANLLSHRCIGTRALVPTYQHYHLPLPACTYVGEENIFEGAETAGEFSK